MCCASARNHCVTVGGLHEKCQSIPSTMGAEGWLRGRTQADRGGKMVHPREARCPHLDQATRNLTSPPSFPHKGTCFMSPVPPPRAPPHRQASPRTSAAGVWVRDSDARACLACGAPFTFLRRRHHCRRCGEVFCGACTPHQAMVPQVSHKPVRVCEPCMQARARRTSQAPAPAAGAPTASATAGAGPGATSPGRVTGEVPSR
jgi:hypothetical protein